MLSSVSTKEKKKESSSSKQSRSNSSTRTSKRNRKIDLKKSELIQLLARFEAELQAKDISLAALKSDKLQVLLNNAQSDCLSDLTNPYGALMRASQYFKDDAFYESVPMKNIYKTQFVQLEKLIVQQKQHVEKLRVELQRAEKKSLALSQELENERKDKIRLQKFQNLLLITENEKQQLRNDLNEIKLHSKELEENLIKTVKLLEHEHERHKKFVILFLNERKFENKHYHEQLKQISNSHTNDENERDAKFHELTMENERDKNILMTRIKQLQNQIDTLVKEKQQQATSNNSIPSKDEMNQSKIQSQLRQSSPTSVLGTSPPPSSVTELSPPSSTEKSSTSTASYALKSSVYSPVSSSLSKDSNNNKIVERNSSYPIKGIHQNVHSLEQEFDSTQSFFKAIHLVVQNRLKYGASVENTKIVTSNIESELLLFRAAETGDANQLLKLLKLGCNSNCQMLDGNTCLHISCTYGHIECIRNLLQFDANPYLENNLGITSWDNLSTLNETIQMQCLNIFIDYKRSTPPINYLFNAIKHNHMSIYEYILKLSIEKIKEDRSTFSQLLRITLRSTNATFLKYLFNMITIQDLIQSIDSNTFISNECLTFLSLLENKEVESSSTNITVLVSSLNYEHRYSYAIGILTLTRNMSWLELERSCVKLFLDHMSQMDSPFDYGNFPLGLSSNNIHTLAFGSIKWYYQDSPSDSTPLPYAIAQQQKAITIQLKNIELNSTDSLAYNYLVPSQSLKTILRFLEQHRYVGVYGAAYLQKKSLFDDLLKYFDRPTTSSANPKFRIIKYEFEYVTSLDDCIDELVEQNFLQTTQLQTKPHDQYNSSKVLLYFANVQKNGGSTILNLLVNSETVSDTCKKLSYVSEEQPNSARTYYFPSMFNIFVTLSKRAWSGEGDIYKKFKWIPFKLDNAPWNGLLKRHLWRRMIDANIRENRPTDENLIKVLQWVTNIWQRYNECLRKFSLQDASFGPCLFYDCPMERESIFEWLQTKWNTIIAPLVRDLSINRCAQPKSSGSHGEGSMLRTNSLEIGTPYESVACTTLYVLLNRAVMRDCPLIGHEREQYIMNFIGSRLEGGSSSSSIISSTASSRAGTPQLTVSDDFVSIQLE